MELLIAATIFSVLVTGLTSHLRGGGIVWRRTTETVEALQRQRAGLDQVARDLANAVVYDIRSEAYGAEAGTLPLPGFAPDEMDWFTVSSRKGAVPSVRFVTYRCEERDGVWGLWRTSQSVGEARARQTAPTPESILEGCRALSLRYAYAPIETGQPLDWKPQWPPGTGAEGALQLPRLVEVTVELESGRTLQRVAAVPAGVLMAFGE